MRLRPLNHATCPRCRGKKTARGGYSKEHKGSLWKCSDCGAEFVVTTLVLKKQE